MRKKTIKFSINLLIISFIAKILSFLCRIILARTLNTTAMSYYAMLMPCLIILITFVQLGIPQVLSKLLADKNYKSSILSTSIYFTIFTTTITTLIYFICIPFLSSLLFKQPMYSLFYCVLPFLPLVSLSGLLKGYLSGKQCFISSNISQIVEEISRIAFLLIMYHYFTLTVIDTTRIAILSIAVGEFFSALFMGVIILFYQSHNTFKMKYETNALKQILHHSIPMSGSRFIGSFTYFFEPILMNLHLEGVNLNQVSIQYGLLNGYALPLLTLPSFISLTLANYLLPAFTFQYSRNNKKYAYRLFIKTTCFAFLCGIFYTILLFIYSEQICMFLYGSTESLNMLKACIIPFALYSVQPILGIMLHAIEKPIQSSIDTFIGSCIRLSIIFYFTPILLGNALPIALVVGMLVTTILHMIRISWFFHKEKNKQ